jgi:hypothetical protein
MDLGEYITITGDPKVFYVIGPFLSMWVFLWLFDIHLMRYLKDPWRRNRLRYLWDGLAHPRNQSKLNDSGRYLIRRWRKKLVWSVGGLVFIGCLIAI